MSEPAAAPKKGFGLIKYLFTGALGLGGGVVAMYSNAIVNQIAKPSLPIANFAVAADGLSVTCQNHASGDSGWWDFGDGSSLEPFTPDQPAVTHAYSKPGSYAVKLTVRNFLAEQNDRTVPVTVAEAAKDTATATPQVVGFAVKPVSPVSVAPATFRVTADVSNADHCVWDFGDGRLEVVDGGGKIDRLVTFEKPGSFPVELVAHNNKTAAKQSAAVKVDSPQSGTLMAVLKVTDSGSRVERLDTTETVVIATQRDKAPPTFSRTVLARPGFVFVSAAPAHPSTPGVKNLQVAVAADKKSAAVTGERLGDAKAGQHTGSDILIPLKMTEERATAARPRASIVTGAFMSVPDQPGGGLAPLPLPTMPVSLTGRKREIVLEVRQVTESGPPRVLATAPLTLQPGSKPLWSAVLPLGGAKYQFQAVQAGDSIQVSYAAAK